MKTEDKIFGIVYALMGAAAAFVIHFVLLGGWKWLALGRKHPSFLNGPKGMALCVLAGTVFGALLYWAQEANLKHSGLGGDGDVGDGGEKLLMVKRVMVAGGCLIGLYFVWDLAKGL